MSAARNEFTSKIKARASPWYMSPEQLRSFKNVDVRTDIWALGVILHRLLTGRQPFEAESLSACITRIVADPPVALREVRADAPPELEGLILRCLEKDVSRRIQNIAELARRLLPFAPPRSALSVERIHGVLAIANPIEEMTIPLRPVAVAAIAPAVRAVSTPDLPQRGDISAAVARSLADSAPPRARGSRWRLIAAATMILGAAAAGAAVHFGAPAGSLAASTVSTASTTSTAPDETTSSSAVVTVAPAGEVMTAAASVKPVVAPAPIPPPALSPAVHPKASSSPSASPKPPAKKVTGPLETAL